jgi:D-glycero-D-manno-heptose 1,7-bisphosphate phosphatase
MTDATPKPALFLDRDGVINVDRGYVFRPEDFEWVEGAADCVSHFRSSGYSVFVVTNQSGIARNYYTEEQMLALHDWMRGELRLAGADVDAVYHCPFHAEGENPVYRRESDDRKPGPGMLLKAMAEFPVRREGSFLIGDKISDVQAAEAAGLPGFLFTGGNLKDFAVRMQARLSARAAR